MSCMEEATSPWFLPVPCGDRSPEGWPLQERSESRDFSSSRLLRRPSRGILSFECRRNGHRPFRGAIKHHLASQDFSRTKRPASNQALQKIPRQKVQNTGRSFLYSANEQSPFPSPSPSEYPFPCTKTMSFIQYNFRFFSPLSVALLENWRLVLCCKGSASGILTAHRLCKTWAVFGQVSGSITLSMAISRPLSFKPPRDGHISSTIVVTRSQINFIPSGAALSLNAL